MPLKADTLGKIRNCCIITTIVGGLLVGTIIGYLGGFVFDFGQKGIFQGLFLSFAVFDITFVIFRCCICLDKYIDKLQENEHAELARSDFNI